MRDDRLPAKVARIVESLDELRFTR